MAREAVRIGDNARTVLERRYLLKDKAGDPIESPESLFARVAEDIASAELEWNGDPRSWEDRFYTAMASMAFLPNSPTLMNAGRDLGQLAACFVLPIEDSLDSIFETLKLTALIHQSGGGTGFAFSRLRPRGDTVKTTNGVSSGPVSFLEVYDAATEHIKQGSFRRGANMGVLDVTHPDILEFISSKAAGGLTNFNISVGVTEEWMHRASAGTPYTLVNPNSGDAVADLNASDVFSAITESAWATGDPGLVFVDRINQPRGNPTPFLGQIEATNPCGEQPLLPFEACVLGSVNLGLFAQGGEMAWDALGETVRLGVRFLDNAIERSKYPISQIESMHKLGNRKIGLGVMGWADALVRLGVPYDSKEATNLASRVMAYISATADATSVELASARGTFPNWVKSVYGPKGLNQPHRNATRTTIAPTGTISIIAGCSSGIEPLYALSFHRKVMEGSVLTELNADFQAAIAGTPIDDDVMIRAITARGAVRGLDSVPSDLQALYGTAHDIDSSWHLQHQAAFQKHVDNAVSKTINLPNAATVEDVKAAYMLAFELGCKGVTVYRDGSKVWQVLNKGTPSGEGLVTMEGSAPGTSEDQQLTPPNRGQTVFEICPVCGQPSFEFAEACGKCHACGHSTC
jgi:ribonucleoside-diphosphate reductase alpha chain